MSWFRQNFINECFPALLRHSGTGGGIIEIAPDTIILIDEDGNEVAAHLTDSEVELTATANDIRLGTTAITNDGVTHGRM